ncbi:MAG TPA: CopG family transcriptional regulator [Conexibacter sp.]|nr:CopG family transcriptional regulator [Conexibacter sp.]
MRRTQIYLADSQERALADRADRLGRTKSALIREAIDSYLTPDSAEQTGLARLRTAVADARGCAQYLPAGERYVDELRAADRERARELDERSL